MQIAKLQNQRTGKDSCIDELEAELEAELELQRSPHIRFGGFLRVILVHIIFVHIILLRSAAVLRINSHYILMITTYDT